MTTASASTPRFFTSAWVMSRIMPAFCSSVRPAAMLTVISGISHSLCFLVHLPDPAHPSFERWTVGSTPLHVMPRQHFAHLGDDLAFPARELRRPRLPPFLVGGDRSRRLGAFDQILDL